MTSKALPGAGPRFLACLLVLSGILVAGAIPALATDKKASADAWGVVIQPRDPKVIISQFDQNKDGKVDRTEYTLGIVAFFVELDKNGDGFLTRDEVPGLKDGAFEEIDTNKDGKISDYEFVTSDTLKFEKIDSNSDGFITADEVAAYQKSRS